MHTAVHRDVPHTETTTSGQANPEGASPQQDAEHNGVDASSIATSVVGYIEKNPLVATAAALAVGAAVVMVIRSRQVANNGLDRRAMRVARSMERTFAKEMRALRNSDLGVRAGQIGQSVGDAVGKVDLAALVDLGRNYVEAARNRIKV